MRSVALHCFRIVYRVHRAAAVETAEVSSNDRHKAMRERCRKAPICSILFRSHIRPPSVQRLHILGAPQFRREEMHGSSVSGAIGAGERIVIRMQNMSSNRPTYRDGSWKGDTACGGNRGALARSFGLCSFHFVA